MKANNMLTEKRLNNYIYDKYILYLRGRGIPEPEIYLNWTFPLFVECTNNYLSLYEQDVILFESIKYNNYLVYFYNFEKYVNDISQKMIMYLQLK